ncbi:helix-turn-helix transcriptional regulator [Actinoallomurus bryophytorum]|uniref:Transcriptional regulator with XRE-family HTH domain n=1 Tax=Actinoallomurus bryophytorum TaxID=1490222 RepID=A0A543CL29_9ACTN|nr:helix-turn-helix transcriptional regulator [Actinoallomurus bryophytorum]TQL97801.1 transcriptional regulator with XRE-family HTH domain [Actinoallomurus bryophytorum]
MTNLGDYLRARRELVRPEDVGLPGGARRRVRGLRREELAMLAGISSDYYMRLEQGRDRHPSAQVLDSLASVLGLDADAVAHLHRLVEPAARHEPLAVSADVPAGIEQLIEGWTGNPACVQDPLMNVLAANAIATALSPAYTPGRNMLKTVFLDPVYRKLRPDWDQAAASGVAGLRALAGANVDDPALVELVGELSARSERFRELWLRHDVRPRRGGGIVRFTHPRVGPLDLRGEKLAITDADGLTLVVFHAEPGSPSAGSLALLAASVPVAR